MEVEVILISFLVIVIQVDIWKSTKILNSILWISKWAQHVTNSRPRDNTTSIFGASGCFLSVLMPIPTTITAVLASNTVGYFSLCFVEVESSKLCSLYHTSHTPCYVHEKCPYYIYGCNHLFLWLHSILLYVCMRIYPFDKHLVDMHTLNILGHVFWWTYVHSFYCMYHSVQFMYCLCACFYPTFYWVVCILLTCRVLSIFWIYVLFQT